VPQILDQVPVNRRGVVSAALGVGAAHGNVYRAPEFLVQEDILAETLDVRVDAETKLADPLRTGIDAQDRPQVILVCPGVRRRQLAVLPGQANVVDQTAAQDSGELESDLPVHGGRDRRGKNLAVGHVDPAVPHAPLAPGDAETQVRAPAEHADFGAGFETPSDRLPVLRRRSPVEQAGGEVHVQERRQVRLGLARQMLVGYPRQAPTGLFPTQGRDLALGLLTERQAVGGDVGVLVQARGTPQPEIDIGPLHAVGLDLRHPGDLVRRAETEQRMPQRFGQKLNLDLGAGLDRRLVDGAHQRLRLGLAHGDHHALAGPHLGAVVDQDIG